MKNFAKKVLACCLVAAMALTCFVGALTVNAENAAGTIVAGNVEVASDATSVVVPVTINADAALNAAKITVAAEGYTVDSIAVASGAAYIDDEDVNGGTFLIQANDNVAGFATAVVNVTLAADAAVAADVVITLDEVHAATWDEAVVDLAITNGAITVKAAEPTVKEEDPAIIAAFQTLLNVSDSVGYTLIFTLPAGYDDFKISVDRDTFNTSYNLVPKETVVLDKSNPYYAVAPSYYYLLSGYGMYELSLNTKFFIECYNAGELAGNATVNVCLDDFIKADIAKDGTSQEIVDLYSELIWLGDSSITYFKNLPANASSDIQDVDSPALNFDIAKKETYSPIEGTATKDFTGGLDCALYLNVSSSPAILYAYSGVTADLQANGNFKAVYTNKKGQQNVAEAALGVATDKMMVLSGYNYYTHSGITLYDGDKMVTATVTDGDGNVVGTYTTSLNMLVRDSLTSATGDMKALYERVLIFGETARVYFE